jgi:hypothetical protein
VEFGPIESQAVKLGPILGRQQLSFTIAVFLNSRLVSMRLVLNIGFGVPRLYCFSSLALVLVFVLI